MSDLEALREEWKTLYSQTLPKLAKNRDPAQSKWPVTLDHCFARIILDNVIGEGARQWDSVIKKPAVKNMSETQLRDAISLGEQIMKGEMDLVELDQISLMARGKHEGKYGGEKRNGEGGKENVSANLKRKAGDASLTSPAKKRKAQADERQSKLPFTSKSPKAEDTKISNASASKSKSEAPSPSPSKFKATNIDYKATLARIQSHPSLTPYRKRLYTILLSVPRGRYTTYAAMSDYLRSSARAVGSGMRNNPFAPDVPCHRVVAADGKIGGFHGEWGEEGKYAEEKVRMLRGEGVRFDGKGRVVGEVFRGFHEFEGM
jgi:O-6-methylguanine DNA methyltransferase